MNKILMTLILLIFFSCAIVQESDVTDIRNNIIFFNGLAESLSIMDIKSETIKNNVKTTGIWPNHITYDTDLILVNSGDNTLSILNIDDLELKKEIYLGSGKNPWMAFPVPETKYIYVSCYLTDQVIKVDRVSGEILVTISVQKNPQGGVILGKKLFIGNTGSDSISVINIMTDIVEQTIILPNVQNRTKLNPQTIIGFDNKNEIHVVCSGINNFVNSDGVIMVLTSDTYEVKSVIETGGSPVYSEGSINEKSKTVNLYGTTGITAYNYETYEIVETGVDNLFISGLIYIPDTNKFYASDFDADSILIYRGDDYSYEKSVQASDGPQQLLYIKE